MSYLHDEIDDESQRHSAYNQPSRELTLSTPAILGIFFGLALLCAMFFGFGYNMGSKSHQAPIVASTPNTPATTNFDSFKPAPGSPAPVQPAPVVVAPPADAASTDTSATATSTSTPAQPAPVVRTPSAPSSGGSFPSRSFCHSGVRNRPYFHRFRSPPSRIRKTLICWSPHSSARATLSQRAPNRRTNSSTSRWGRSPARRTRKPCASVCSGTAITRS